MPDWRAENAIALKGLKLQRRSYEKRSESWDHDHCAACWAKFAELDRPDVQHEGYTTCDDYKFGAYYDWVCLTCFSELKAEMGWTESPPEELESPCL
jgi:hypothetical protein